MSGITETSNQAEILGPLKGHWLEILTPGALAFVAELHRRFDPERRRLLAARQERQERLDSGERPDFLAETREIRESDWTVAPAPDDLRDRRVEITGPVDRKMVINALNSGARVFMADFEDANSPTWSNNLEGQINLRDAAEGTIDYDTGEKYYKLVEDPAVLVVRPRGWHLPERHLHVDGEAVSGSLFDFGLYVFHNPERPWFYIPKLESRLEARLWNEVFDFTEEALRLEPGSIKATVLIENVLAAFEMDEILYELREHIVGSERRALGLPLQPDQAAAVARHRAARPRPADDDDALHARLHGAARQDLPPARRPRHGRDGRVHPEPARSRGERARSREGAGGQSAGGR